MPAHDVLVLLDAKHRSREAARPENPISTGNSGHKKNAQHFSIPRRSTGTFVPHREKPPRARHNHDLRAVTARYNDEQPEKKGPSIMSIKTGTVHSVNLAENPAKTS